MLKARLVFFNFLNVHPLSIQWFQFFFNLHPYNPVALITFRRSDLSPVEVREGGDLFLLFSGVCVCHRLKKHLHAKETTPFIPLKGDCFSGLIFLGRRTGGGWFFHWFL